jgi:beta-galactosidase/beta-glucuronidase
MRVLGALLALPALANAAGLVDDPIVADSITYLDGTNWKATSSAGISIDASVPGDLLSDLEAANVIGDPLYELNWLNSSIWNNYTWTYSTSFAMPSGAGTPLLVFDGVKMGARIMLNGKQIATVNDQFMRYVFPMEKSVLQANNMLDVVFDPAIDCAGRWMACTGGWDWAPYTNTFQDKIPTMTKGIWKSVSIVEVGSAAITAVVPQIFYSGDYPMAPLTDETHKGFAVDVKVFTWAAAETKGTLSVTGSWGKGAEQVTVATQAVTIPKGNTSTTAKLTAGPGAVKLWWPAGHGEQPLYNISVSFTPAAVATTAAGAITTTRRVGFRHFAVVTGDDTDAAYVKASTGKEGTDKLGMLWRINGAAIFSKGANSE